MEETEKALTAATLFPPHHLLSPLYFYLLQYTLSYLVSLSQPLCCALHKAFCSLAWRALMFPFRGEGRQIWLLFVFSVLVQKQLFFLSRFAAFFPTVEESLPHFNNNNNDNILHNAEEFSCCFFYSLGHNPWSATEIQGQPGGCVLTQGL